MQNQNRLHKEFDQIWIRLHKEFGQIVYCGSVAAYHIITNYKCAGRASIFAKKLELSCQSKIWPNFFFSRISHLIFFAMQFYKIVNLTRFIMSPAQSRKNEEFRCNFAKFLSPLWKLKIVMPNQLHFLAPWKNFPHNGQIKFWSCILIYIFSNSLFNFSTIVNDSFCE